MFHFRLREPSTIPIDFTGILPETLRGLSLTDVAKKPVLAGNRRAELGELFDVQPNTVTKKLEVLIIDGDCSQVNNIGADMTESRIAVWENAGCHVGARMRDGSISIAGSAGDWLGAEMAGGAIWVTDAGAYVGAAYVGSPRGMTGGVINISGDAGGEVGRRMRRGSIHIDGSCGEFAGKEMIAGTICVEKSLGNHPGTGMKRGTIISCGELPSLAPSFRYACEFQPAYLSRFDEYARERTITPFDLSRKVVRTVRCYRGDLLTGGRGEIWQVIA